MGAEPDIMEFVEQMGGYFESRSLTRLAGRLLGWLLVCDPERQSSEELATALAASSGGISTNARMLIQFGFIERLAVAGDRRTYFRLRPNAFAAGERERIRAMAELQDLADVGLRALGDAPAAAKPTAAGDAGSVGIYGERRLRRPGAIQPANRRGRLMSNLAI